MDLEFTANIWEAMQTHIDPHERKDAAETLVSFLIDMGAEASDINDAFSSHREVIKALKEYVDQFDDEPSYEDDDDSGIWGED
jgi:hypothetical protein